MGSSFYRVWNVGKYLILQTELEIKMKKRQHRNKGEYTHFVVQNNKIVYISKQQAECLQLANIYSISKFAKVNLLKDKIEYVNKMKGVPSLH